jgi:hypothetical protein
MSELETVSREHFIPFRFDDLLQLCLDDQALAEQERRRFERLGTLLGRYFHLEFHRKLKALKDNYVPFNPDIDTLPIREYTPAALKERQQALVHVLGDVVEAANFRVISQADLDHAMAEESLFNIRLDVDFNDFEQVLFYRRGESRKKAQVRKWYSWKYEEIEFTNYERVLVYVKFKEEAYFKDRDPKELFFKPGSTMIKLFRNIPKADLEMLFPNTEVAMKVRDKIMIGVPAAVSGVLVLVTKLGSTLLLVGAFIAFWLGWREEPVAMDQSALVALGVGLGSLAAYLWKQFSAFKNRKIRFMKVLADNLYFKNLDNNAGVFHRLIDAAEEAESKEAMLAYYMLYTNKDGMTADALDRAVEQWLSRYGGRLVDFEIADALRKLHELGLVTEEEGLLKALPLDEALENLKAVAGESLFAMAESAA